MCVEMTSIQHRDVFTFTHHLVQVNGVHCIYYSLKFHFSSLFFIIKINLNKKERDRRIHFRVTFCYEWPWKSTHTTTTLCGSFALYASVPRRSLGEMKCRHTRLLFHLWIQSSLFLHYQLGRCCTNPDCQSNYNPSFFHSLTGSALTLCQGGCRNRLANADG